MFIVTFREFSVIWWLPEKKLKGQSKAVNQRRSGITMIKKEQTYEQWSTNHYKEIKDWTIQTPLITNVELRKGKKRPAPLETLVVLFLIKYRGRGFIDKTKRNMSKVVRYKYSNWNSNLWFPVYNDISVVTALKRHEERCMHVIW